MSGLLVKLIFLGNCLIFFLRFQSKVICISNSKNLFQSFLKHYIQYSTGVQGGLFKKVSKDNSEIGTFSTF